jgi:hypothetical protein
MSLVIRKKEKGFSLAEVLIYCALLTAITFFITQSVLTLLNSHSKIVLARTVEYSAESAMNKIVFEIKKASSVNLGSSSLGTNPGTLALAGSEAGTNYTIVFSIQNGKIVFSKDGGASTPLTSSDVTIPNLIFKTTSTANSIAVKVDMTVTGIRSGVARSLDLSSFAVLRGSY